MPLWQIDRRTSQRWATGDLVIRDPAGIRPESFLEPDIILATRGVRFESFNPIPVQDAGEVFIEQDEAAILETSEGRVLAQNVGIGVLVVTGPVSNETLSEVARAGGVSESEPVTSPSSLLSENQESLDPVFVESPSFVADPTSAQFPQLGGRPVQQQLPSGGTTTSVSTPAPTTSPSSAPVQQQAPAPPQQSQPLVAQFGSGPSQQQIQEGLAELELIGSGGSNVQLPSASFVFFFGAESETGFA